MATIDDGGAAFPCPGVYDDEGSQIEVGAVGMSLRDYFAARAPVDIPDTFVHVPAPGKPEPLPTVDGTFGPRPGAPGPGRGGY